MKLTKKLCQKTGIGEMEVGKIIIQKKSNKGGTKNGLLEIFIRIVIRSLRQNVLFGKAIHMCLQCLIISNKNKVQRTIRYHFVY